MWCMNPWSPWNQQWHTFWGKILDWMDAKENAVGGEIGWTTFPASFCCEWPAVASFFRWFSGCEILEYLILLFSFCIFFVFKVFNLPERRQTINQLFTTRTRTSVKFCNLLSSSFFKKQVLWSTNYHSRLGNETTFDYNSDSFPDFLRIFVWFSWIFFCFIPVQINHTMPRSSHPLGPTKMFETRQQELRSLHSCLTKFSKLNQWSLSNSSMNIFTEDKRFCFFKANWKQLFVKCLGISGEVLSDPQSGTNLSATRSGEQKPLHTREKTAWVIQCYKGFNKKATTFNAANWWWKVWW